MIAFQSDTAFMATCSKIQTDVLDELPYADCAAKNVLTEKMQKTMDRVSQVCDNYDLTIRKKNNGVGYSQHLESPKWSQPSRLRVID